MPSNGGAQRHAAAGPGRDGFAQVAELAVLGAHNERPQAAEQVVEACCDCGKGENVFVAALGSGETCREVDEDEGAAHGYYRCCCRDAGARTQDNHGAAE